VGECNRFFRKQGRPALDVPPQPQGMFSFPAPLAVAAQTVPRREGTAGLPQRKALAAMPPSARRMAMSGRAKPQAVLPRLCMAEHCFLLVGESPRRHPANTLAITQLSQRALPAMKVQRDSGRLARIAASDLPALRSLFGNRAGLSLCGERSHEIGTGSSGQPPKRRLRLCTTPRTCRWGMQNRPGNRAGTPTMRRHRATTPPGGFLTGERRGSAPPCTGHGRHDRARTIEHMFPCSSWSLPSPRAMTQGQVGEFFCGSVNPGHAMPGEQAKASGRPAPSVPPNGYHKPPRAV
jgi:hypothetical protein